MWNDVDGANDNSIVFSQLFIEFDFFQIHKLFVYFAIFQLNHDSNPTMLIMLVVEAFYAFGVIFVICELCQRVSDRFEESNDTMEKFDWISFPIEVQRMLPIVIISAQQSTQFKVFGSTVCCRESFQKASSFDQFPIKDLFKLK